jgi:hypothetical protein
MYIKINTVLAEIAKEINYAKSLPTIALLEDNLPQLRELWQQARDGEDAAPIMHKIIPLMNLIKYSTGRRYALKAHYTVNGMEYFLDWERV